MDTINMNYDLERKPDPSKRLSLYQKAFGEHMAKKDAQKETAENGTNGRRKKWRSLQKSNFVIM